MGIPKEIKINLIMPNTENIINSPTIPQTIVFFPSLRPSSLSALEINFISPQRKITMATEIRRIIRGFSMISFILLSNAGTIDIFYRLLLLSSYTGYDNSRTGTFIYIKGVLKEIN